ncbi:MAG: hypothetical protein Q8N95_13425 [Desulfobacterales bacterium]|nr:hypothetical protein [Desulfobacterales bacterium]
MKNDFSEMCKNTFDTLFQEAKNTNKIQFLTSFFPFGKINENSTLSYISDYEFAEVLDLLDRFVPLQAASEINIKDKVRIQMFLYCHIVEVDLIYHIVFNMIQTIKKNPYSLEIFTIRRKNSNNGEKGTKKIAEYPCKKIEIIKNLSDEFEMPLRNVYQEFYLNKLRNSFSHSQYFIEQDGTFHLSQSLSQFQQKSTNGFYTAESIDSFFQKSLFYIKAFINSYNSYIEEFKDGNSYDTSFGKISFSIPEHNGWGFVRKNEIIAT